MTAFFVTRRRVLETTKLSHFKGVHNIYVDDTSILCPPDLPLTPPRGCPRPTTTTARDVTAARIRKLTSLLDVSQALASPVNLKSAFHRVLEILERYHGTEPERHRVAP